MGPGTKRIEGELYTKKQLQSFLEWLVNWRAHLVKYGRTASLYQTDARIAKFTLILMEWEDVQ